MDKQNQIEDIKNLLVCEKWGDYFMECEEHIKCVDCIANKIYKAGYRKIHKNAVILSQEQWAEHNEQYANTMYQNELRTRAKTVKEIIDIIKHEYDYNECFDEGE